MNVWGRRSLALLAILGLLAFPGCRTAYYAAWEKMGKHKRDLLQDNVEKVREEQVEASEQFKDALARLKELYRFEGGELESKYNKLNGSYEHSVAQAEDVRRRIREAEQVATDLFSEWQNEIEQISNTKLRASSQRRLRNTQTKFADLLRAMKQAEASMEPVLTQLRDQVLYLKHNLNAQAIASLRGEAADIEREVAELIKDINAAIAEADAFIRAMPNVD